MLNKCLNCNLPCFDVNRDFIYPQINLDLKKIELIMISEAPPAAHSDYYYKNKNGSFFNSTQTAFSDAGISVSSYDDITNLKIYLTTAIKCSKKHYLVSTGTIKSCSKILEQEIDQFPNLKVIMCMGDFAIKAINYISRRKYNKNAIPSGSTYKIRKGIYILDGIRYFPSYTQTGAGFDMEKSKRRMIAGDIKTAMSIIQK